MSIRLMSLIWDVTFPTQSQLLIALKLADFASDEGGSIFPSHSHLADKAQSNVTTVKVTLRAFRAIGLLQVVKAGGAGPKSTTHYAFNMPMLKSILNGEIAISGGSTDLEIKTLEKGAESAPLGCLRGRPDDLRGRPSDPKGVQGHLQSFTNHQLDSSARERAVAPKSAPASAAKEAAPANNRRVSILIGPKDPSWSAWLDAIETQSGAAMRVAAERSGQIDAAARWPKRGVPLPVVKAVRLPAGEDA